MIQDAHFCDSRFLRHHAGVKAGWRLAWQVMVKELAPQDKSGAYVRQSYTFTSKIGDKEFPVRFGMSMIACCS